MSTNQKQQVEGSAVEFKLGEKSNGEEIIKSVQYNLSDSSQISDWNQQIKNDKQTSESIFTFLKEFIIAFWYMFTAVFLLLFVSIMDVFSKKKDRKDFMWVLWTLLASTSIIYTYIRYFFIGIENVFINRLYLDGVFFVISSLFVFSYIIAIQDKDEDENNFYAFLSTLTQLDGNTFYYKQDYQIEYIYERPHFIYSRLDACYFSRGKESSKRTIELLSPFEKFDVNDYNNYTHFKILVFVILIKLTAIFYYTYLQPSFLLNTINIIDMSLIIFVYIQTCYSLLRVFGSYDLRRKECQMIYFTELIDFCSEDLQQNYHSKLDITDPKSLEAFDNARKLVFNHEEQLIQKLDYSYVGLVFYYLFVIIICLSYYFELDWLIQKDSSLLDPIQVIISSGNFIFLSAFLMFRFQYGTKFNNTFQELQVKFDYIYDITCDLINMYEHFFLQKSKEKYEKFSLYGLLVKKVKVMSKHIIKNKISYQGEYYEKHQKQALRKELLTNMKFSIEKVKKSIETDCQAYKYLFMGQVEIDFYSFLFTLLLSVASILPTIIPKFLQFYKK